MQTYSRYCEIGIEMALDKNVINFLVFRLFLQRDPTQNSPKLLLATYYSQNRKMKKKIQRENNFVN